MATMKPMSFGSNGGSSIPPPSNLVAKPVEEPVIEIPVDYGDINTSLAARVQSDWTRASNARIYQETKVFLRALYAMRANYGPEMQAGETSMAYVNATRPKVQAAVALLVPIVCPPGMPSWTLDQETDAVDPEKAFELLQAGVEPDKIKDVLFQMSGKKADALSSKIKKSMDNTRFNDKILRYLWDMAWSGTGIMLGPLKVQNPEVQPLGQRDDNPWDVVRRFIPFLGEKKDPRTILIEHGILDEYLASMEVISPLDFYPDPSGYTMEMCRFAIWRMTLGKAQIQEMLLDPSFKKDQVEALLRDAPDGLWEPVSWETSLNSLNNNQSQNMPGGRYNVLQWWGFMTGRELSDYGVTTIPPDKMNERVIVQIWTCKGKVLKAAVSEIHKDRLPFYVTPYSYAPNSIWGVGVAELMFDSGDAIQACERAAMDNMALIRLPQVAVDVTQLADPYDTLSIGAGHIWKTKSVSGATTKPIEIWNIQNALDSILAVQRNEERLAQEQTGLPSFLMGVNGQGTHNRTAEGANLQFNNAITPLKTVVYNLENNLIVPMINSHIRFFQMTSNDPAVKGAYRVNVNGIKGLLARESIIQSFQALLQAMQGFPEEVKRLKLGNMFNSYIRYSGLANEDLVMSDSEYAALQETERKMAEESKAFDAGVQSAANKTRAEISVRDALVEMVKQSPENSSLRLAYMELVNQECGVRSPDLDAAMDQQKELSGLSQEDTAERMGHEAALRQMTPIPDPMANFRNLPPQAQPGALPTPTPEAPIES